MDCSTNRCSRINVRYSLVYRLYQLSTNAHDVRGFMAYEQREKDYWGRPMMTKQEREAVKEDTMRRSREQYLAQRRRLDDLASAATGHGDQLSIDHYPPY